MWSTAGVDDEITSSAKVTREIRANNGGGVLRAGVGAERPLCGFHRARPLQRARNLEDHLRSWFH